MDVGQHTSETSWAPRSTLVLAGYVSRADAGQGRTSTDRQFVYINGRPVDMPKVTKLVNEVYRQYNMHQVPFLVLDVRVASGAVDVNVTPDKRTVFLRRERDLLGELRVRPWVPLSPRPPPRGSLRLWMRGAHWHASAMAFTPHDHHRHAWWGTSVSGASALLGNAVSTGPVQLQRGGLGVAPARLYGHTSWLAEPTGALKQQRYAGPEHA